MDRLIPYSTDVYNAIISDHNLSLWPLQVFVVVLCLSVIGLARRGGANNVAFMILAVFWIWCGVHFHITTYATINRAAHYFGYAFIIQGVAIALWTFWTRGQFVKPQHRVWVWAGIGLIISAAVLHPLLLTAMNAPITYAEIPGVMPMPTAALTLGVLFLMPQRFALWLLVIPVNWSLWDGMSAWTLGQNLSLILPCIVVIAAFCWIMKTLSNHGSSVR